MKIRTTRIIVPLLIIGALAVAWFSWGRYVAKGGKVLWAVENHDPKVLSEGLDGKPSDSKLNEALRIALANGDLEMAKTLGDHGARVNSAEREHCLLAELLRFGKVEEAAYALEVGEDPGACSFTPTELMIDLLKFGHNKASQDVIIRVMRPLIEAGGDPLASEDIGTPSVLTLAEGYELDEVAAFMKEADEH
jgi:hypothetical protein